MNSRIFLSTLAALLPLSAAAGEEVGEWALDAAWCDEARMGFTADGRHTTRVSEDGQWQELASAPYRRDGNVLIVESPELTERLQVLDESSEKLVLRNTDEERQRMTGVAQLELVRCPDVP